jgi:hypothetical protein
MPGLQRQPLTSVVYATGCNREPSEVAALWRARHGAGGELARRKTATAQRTRHATPSPWAQAGSRNTSRPVPATSPTTGAAPHRRVGGAAGAAVPAWDGGAVGEGAAASAGADSGCSGSWDYGVSRHVGRPAVGQGEPGRVVHPGVDGDDEERAGDAGDRDREAGQEVRSRREPVPAVGVDAGDDAHGEQREHDPRPAPGERAVERVAGSQVPVFGDENQNRERDAEAHQRDVRGERECLHLPRFEQVVLIDTYRDLPYA